MHFYNNSKFSKVGWLLKKKKKNDFISIMEKMRREKWIASITQRCQTSYYVVTKTRMLRDEYQGEMVLWRFFFSHDIADVHFHKFMLTVIDFDIGYSCSTRKPAERNIASSTGCSLCPCINIENTNRSELLTSLLSFARRAIYPLMVMLPSSCALAQRECYLSVHGAVTIDFHSFPSRLASITSRNVNPQ